jgi:hypothetical protein
MQPQQPYQQQPVAQQPVQQQPVAQQPVQQQPGVTYDPATGQPVAVAPAPAVAYDPVTGQPVAVDPAAQQAAPATAGSVPYEGEAQAEDSKGDALGAILAMLVFLLVFGVLGYAAWYAYQASRGTLRSQLQDLLWGGGMRTMQNPQRANSPGLSRSSSAHAQGSPETRATDSGSHIEHGDSCNHLKQPLKQTPVSSDTYRRSVLQANRNNQSESDDDNDNPPPQRSMSKSSSLKEPSKYTSMDSRQSMRAPSKESPSAGEDVKGQTSGYSTRASKSRYRVGQQS